MLSAYGAKRLVVAHTPSLKGIVAAEGGKLVRIDTGNSAYYGGAHSYLEIVGGEAVAHRKEGDGTWSRTVLPAP